MTPMPKPRRRIVMAAAMTAALLGSSCMPMQAPPATSIGAAATAPVGQRIVAMRRLTEAQYRNAVADIFGPDIQVAGRFEPIVRPAHQLIATGAASASVSPAGLEQFDAMARAIAGQVFDARHRAAFLPCAPKDEARPDEACARATLSPLGRYLYRRPMTAQEQDAVVAMAGAATLKSGSFNKGLELALSAMLVSPDFLYVVESAEPDPDRPGQLRLDNYSRAARLSFLLWNTTPNEALLTAAERGRLVDPDQMQAIATAMVKSPRLEDGVRAFFSDMLMFEKFDDIAKDPVVYPRFNPEVAKALPEQMLRMLVDELVTRNGDYRQVFTTRRTFVNRALGPIYNVPVASRTGWQAIELPPEDDRAGLISQAGFLALYAHSGRSSPTLRGRAIRERLLCQPVPDPPGNVNFAVVQDTSNKEFRTARARLNAHANDPSCSSCHRITDPIGLPLERFDGIGAYRAQENGVDIDRSGSFEGTALMGASGLGMLLSVNPATTECVASRALEYATGRPTDDEAELVAKVEKGFSADGYRFSALLLRIATLPETYRPASEPLGPPSQVARSAIPMPSFHGATR